MLNTHTLDDFINALLRLDARLKALNADVLKVRVIGGFAMMFHGVREEGLTIDIDSLTPAFDQSVLDEIKAVGNELGLYDDWLNTDCATLDGFLNDLAPQITWLDTDYPLERIDLKVADLEGLARSKAKAVHDGGLVPRSADKKDLLSLLNTMGVSDLRSLESSDSLSYIRTDYPRTFAFLAEKADWSAGLS